MVPDRQKVRTDGWNGRTDIRTDGRRQNYIPPTLSGDYKLVNTCMIKHYILNCIVANQNDV